MTHLVISCLNYRDFGFEIDQSQNVLDSPETYMPLISSICELYPHLKVVWSMQPVQWRLGICCFDNFYQYMNQYNVDIFEIHLGALTLQDFCFVDLAEEMRSIPCDFWVVAPPAWAKYQMIPIVSETSRIIIEPMAAKSIGDFVHESDNSVLSIALAIEHLSNIGFRRESILISIPTYGLKYSDEKCVGLYTREHIQRSRFKMISSRNHVSGSSWLEDISHEFKILYDDTANISAKLTLSSSVGGVIVDDLDFDGARGNPDAVWTQVAAHSFRKKIGHA